MKTILATGGLGFIGSHTCISLLENGYKVVIIDYLVNSSIEILKRISKIKESISLQNDDQLIFKKGDLRDIKFLDQVFKESESINMPIDAVIHFAGLKSVNESVLDSFSYWNVNVLGTINLLNVMKKNNCFTIVFSSSATVYKPILGKVLNEDSEIGPINPYGRTKLTNELLLKDIFQSESNKWRVALLRYFNPIGAHHSGYLGEMPLGTPNNLFPVLVKVAIGEIKYLSIYGKNWPTLDGTCVRDYVHVMDLADAHVESLNYLFKSKPILLTLNVGTGVGKSVLEVVKTFNEVNKLNLSYKFVKRRDGDAPFIVADNKLAMKLLNWKPKRNLEDMCKDGWLWIKKIQEFRF